MLVVKGDTHKEKTLQTEYTERDDGSRGRDAHPHRQVRAGHPRLGHDARFPDTGRGTDHPLILFPDGSPSCLSPTGVFASPCRPVALQGAVAPSSERRNHHGTRSHQPRVAARFSPGRLVMTSGVDELVQQGSAQSTPTCAAISWRLGRPLRRPALNDAALKSGEDRLFSSYQVTPNLKLWDHHRMGPQRHHAAAAQRVLIRPDGLAPFVLPTRACHRPGGGACPIALEHHHVLDLENRSRNRCTGRPARKRRLPLTLSLQTSYPSSATSC